MESSVVALRSVNIQKASKMYANFYHLMVGRQPQKLFNRGTMHSSLYKSPARAMKKLFN